jgi:hypothetical protein
MRDTPHMIKSEWVHDLINVIVEHTTANARQSSVKVLQNIAYLFAYGGMVRHNMPFYAVDLSPTGTGKTEIVKKCRQLLLTPVFEKQQSEHTNDLERYKQETLSMRGRGNEFVEINKLHKCIHVTDTSPEALFESFEAQKAQMLELGELGRRLKNQKHQTLIDYIVEGYGASELAAPNYKNQRMNKLLKIENPQLFFYGDTTIRYLGKGKFFEHLEGGLLNRCFLVYNPKVPKYDELPENYGLNTNTVNIYNDISMNVIDFATRYKDNHIKTEIAPYWKECERYFYDKKMELIDINSPFSNLYARTIQNFRSLINLFHLIRCFDSGAFIESIETDSIKQAFEFIKWQIEPYPLLMDELSGVMDEIRTDEKSSKILQYISDQKLPIKFRQVQRKFTLHKKDIEIAIAGQFKHDGTNIFHRV